MSYNILGITPGHNGSIALFSDGELIYYIEEERLSRLKRDGNPFKALNFLLNKYKIDELIVTGAGNQTPHVMHTGENMFHCLVRKYNPKVKFLDFSNKHHLTHISNAFFNSGFNEALGIVIDGNGSNFYLEDKKETIFETETLYKCSSLLGIEEINKNYISQNPSTLTIGKTYEAITKYLGFKEGEDGKTMGLASYGKYNSKIPKLLNNKESFSINTNKGVPLGEFIYPLGDSLELKKDLAWKIQQETQQYIGDQIEIFLKLNPSKKIVCSGGYFLNCVANYYFKKRFPNIEFYFDPISHDGGTSIGAVLYRWFKLNNIFISFRSLYYGPKYSKEELLEGIKKYVDTLQ
jgi:carbamoyltransferase